MQRLIDVHTRHVLPLLTALVLAVTSLEERKRERKSNVYSTWEEVLLYLE